MSQLQGNKLQLIEGNDVAPTVEAQDSRVHRYVVNKPGLNLLLVLSFVFFIAAAILWLGGFATSLGIQIAVGICILLGFTCSVTVSYWNGVGARRFVATSEEHLMIGDAERMWMIDWDLLDTQSLGLTNMELSKAGGRLNVQVAGESIPLLLFSPFAYLNEPHEFMAELLGHVQSDEEE